MACKLRIQYPGAIYHVMNRGGRREAVFEDDKDRQRFLETLSEACEKTAWEVHAYCLMSNHFHLVIETPQANLVAGMKWLLGTCTSRYNRRHKECGHLFREGEFKALERGWCLGEEQFRRELLEQVNQRPGPSHFGEAVQEAVEARAERLAAAALRRLSWTEEDLKGGPKGEPDKVEIARELRRQTTMPLAWIAERLRMGARGHLAWLLQRKPVRSQALSGQGLLKI
jgi:REP element-mobilizing transposase RayT